MLRWLRISLLVSALLLITGCSSETETQPATPVPQSSGSNVHYGGTYRVPLMNSPSTLDPARVRDHYGEAVVHQLFDGLVQFGPQLLVVPALAESWRVEENGTVYRFLLRKNARFQNGQPVSAEDVIFSISRLLRIDPPPAILPHLLKIQGAQAFRDRTASTVVGLEAENDRVVRVRLEEPHAPFLTALGMHFAAIVPKEEVLRQGEAFSRHPVGSGPFRMISWEADRAISLERYPDYYAGKAFLDGIRYVIYPGVKIEEVFEDFRRGRLEEMPVYGNLWEELADRKDLKRFHRPALSLLFYGMNCEHPLLKNPAVRKILSGAIDRASLVEAVYRGQFEPAHSILPPGMPGYLRRSPSVPADLPRTRQILREAIGSTGDSEPTLEIVSGSASPFARKEIERIRTQFSQIGVQLEAKFITDWPSFEAYLLSPSMQIYRYAWSADMPDPDSFLYPLFASDSPINFMHYRNPLVDRRLLEAREILDPVKRAEAYREIEKIVLDEPPIIPLFYLSVDRVYQAAVQGVHPSALGAQTMKLHRVWLQPAQSTETEKR